ncbi:MAG: SpoIIE family protein phosphatase, partial [Leptospiraceae bacterium]|nr:SpoIIE family protein phosphatase [Leptospiraceae bacterium]
MRKEITLEDFTKIVGSINSQKDLDSLLNSIIETTKNAIHCDGCSLLLYQKETDSLKFHISSGFKSESLLSLEVPRGKGIAGYVMDTNETVIVNDAQSDPRLYKEIDSKIDFVTRNLICVPMHTQGNFIGVLEAVNTLDRDNFDEKDARELNNISEVAAIAINNRYLIDELNNRLREINSLLKISQALSQIDSIELFLETAGSSIAELLEVQRISYITKTNKDNIWKVGYSKGLSFSDSYIKVDLENSVIARVLESKEPILIENTNKENILFPFSTNYKTNSLISFPLIYKNEIVGVINVTDKINRKLLNKTDLKLLKIIANYMMEVYQTLSARKEKEDINRLKRDLEMASKFQQFSLPHIPDELNDIEISAYYKPSREIGGDFYDLIYHWETQYTFVIADVAGKGIPAALFMEFAKTVLNSEISRYVIPGIALLHSHKIFQEKFETSMHVEVMAVQVDTERRQIKYASAGHNRQIYINSNLKEVSLLRAKGIPLGSGIKISEFPEEIINYNEGDIILLYTDGITEIKNESGTEMFG